MGENDMKSGGSEQKYNNYRHRIFEKELGKSIPQGKPSQWINRGRGEDVSIS